MQWTTKVSSSGRTYYFNELGRRQWHVPNQELDKLRYDSLQQTFEFCDFTKRILEIIVQFLFISLNLSQNTKVLVDSETMHDYFKNLKSLHFNDIEMIQKDTWAIEAWPKSTSDFIFSSRADVAFAEKYGARAFATGASNGLKESGYLLIVVADEGWSEADKNTWGHHSIQRQGKMYLHVVEDGKKCARSEWWVRGERFEEEFNECGLKLVFEANLASFGAWLGVDTPSTKERQAFVRDITSDPESWAEASLYKVLVFSKQLKSLDFASEFMQWLDENRVRVD